MKIGLTLLLLVAIAVAATSGGNEPVPRDPEAEAAKIERELREMSVLELAASLKKATREPDSFKIRSAFANSDGSVVCIEYAGRNGFGGVSVEHAVLAERKVHRGSDKHWNKNCVGKDLYDYTKNIVLR